MAMEMDHELRTELKSKGSRQALSFVIQGATMLEERGLLHDG